MPTEFYRKGNDRFFWGRFTGSVLHYSQISAALMVILTATGVLFWLIFRKEVWLEGWFTFWKIDDLRSLGILLLAAIGCIPWLIVPSFFILTGKTSSGYFIQSASADRFKWFILWLSTFTGVSVAVIIVPSLVIKLTYYGVIKQLFYLVGSIPLASLCAYVFKFFKHLNDKRKLGFQKGGYPKLVSFRTKLRPVNSKVINLDVGALAPRLLVVSDALSSWSKVAEGSAPTAKMYWETISGPRSGLPKEWSQNLKGLAFSNIEWFRKSIAALLNVADPADIVFVTSTTRALSLILHTLSDFDSIVTTSYEHPSEFLVIKNYSEVNGANVEIVDMEACLRDDSPFEKVLLDAFTAKLQLARRPLCIFSEVFYCLGIRLPVSELVAEIRNRCPEAVVIVDGAHAVGQYNINLLERDFDFYVFSGHKWLFGPASLGVLVLGTKIKNNSAIMENLRSETFESLAFYGNKLGESGSTISLDPFVGLAEVVSIMTPEIRGSIFRNIVAIRTLFDRMAEKSYNFEVIVPSNVSEDFIAPGIVNIQRKTRLLPKDALDRVRDSLERDKNIIVKVVPRPLSLRLCLPFYLEEYELERLVKALDAAFGTRGL